MAWKRKKENWKKIYFVFGHEKEIRKAVAEYRDDPAKGSGGHAGVSDPTAVQALNAVEEVYCITIGTGKLVYPERWLKVIDQTYRWCDSLHAEIARRNFNGEPWVKTCMALHISRATRYNFADEVSQRAMLYAVQARLITID